uniref:Uncharacterized protein n=1 Tax=Octopus bimaculoides TaxID=37653 RepID=A0A0L8IEA5_OCTBM
MCVAIKYFSILLMQIRIILIMIHTVIFMFVPVLYIPIRLNTLNIDMLYHVCIAILYLLVFRTLYLLYVSHIQISFGLSMAHLKFSVFVFVCVYKN